MWGGDPVAAEDSGSHLQSIELANGFALDMPAGVATITAGTAVPSAVVVGSLRRRAHCQHKALTVATENENPLGFT